MKNLSLSTKIFFVSGLILVVLCLASFGILYRAQTQQAVQEMDVLLENEVIALSALVSARPGGMFDFEISPFFLSQYQGSKHTGFFRFIDPNDGKILKESPEAPPSLDCKNSKQGNGSITLGNHGQIFRLKTSIFHPEIDTELKVSSSFKPSLICLVVGIDERPYRSLVMRTLLSTIPLLALLAIFLIGILLILVRRMTSDLSQLTTALETADFGVTHEFPKLPKTQTLEVNAVIEKLVGLHDQAAEVYREMWLFLGRAAHQLKTPISAMQATLQVLLRKERSKEELLSGLADVQLAVGHLTNLTKKLISSSRISFQKSSFDLEWIDIGTFISEQVKIFKSQAQLYEISVSVKTVTPLKILTNSFLLSEILGSLIENAILYSPRGTSAVVSISWQREQQNAAIFISDQGMGFSHQTKKALFEPFIRGDERQISGSGLGLYIAKKSVQLLGGQIALRASGPTGSKLAVILPMGDGK